MLAGLRALAARAAVSFLAATAVSAWSTAQGSRSAVVHSVRVETRPSREREAMLLEALQQTLLRPPVGSMDDGVLPFDQSGWPLPQFGLSLPPPLFPRVETRPAPRPADRGSATDRSEAAFLALGGLTMDVEYSTMGSAGDVLCRRTLRHELSTAASARERIVFPDGRSFSRTGERISAAWGSVDRPDLVDEARGWLDRSGLVLRLPFVAALAREPAGGFVARSSTVDGSLVVNRFERGDETLELVKDASGSVREARHRSPGCTELRILFSDSIAVGAAKIPSVRVLLGADGKTPSLTIRIVRAQQTGR